MKVLLVLLVSLVAVYYFRPDLFSGLKVSGGLPALASINPSSRHDFTEISNLLQQDMNNIPTSLDGDAPKPVHAFDVKRKVRPHVQEHSEYQVLVSVCDLIIQADGERSSLQQSSRSQQSRLTFHSSLDPVEKNKRATPNPANEQAAIHQRVESIWSDHRTRAADEVTRLLDSLKGKTI